MDVEIVEIADRKALDLGEDILLVDEGVIQLDEHLFDSLQNPIPIFGDVEENPVSLRDLHNRFGPLQVDLQGGQGPCLFYRFHKGRLMRIGKFCN